MPFSDAIKHSLLDLFRILIDEDERTTISRKDCVVIATKNHFSELMKMSHYDFQPRLDGTFAKHNINDGCQNSFSGCFGETMQFFFRFDRNRKVSLVN